MSLPFGAPRRLPDALPAFAPALAELRGLLEPLRTRAASTVASDLQRLPTALEWAYTAGTEAGYTREHVLVMLARLTDSTANPEACRLAAARTHLARLRVRELPA